MAENKKSFVLYTEFIETFESLNDEDAGKLVKHLFKYVNDQQPETDNPIVKIAFIPIKQKLKRDLKKYESICERNSKNGAKGGRPKQKKEPKEPKEPKRTQKNPKEPKKADHDNDHDNDKHDINKSLLSEIEISDVPIELQEYYKIALGFQKLFIKNLKEREAPTKNQREANFKNYVTPIRLMIENDNTSREQIRQAYDFLKSKEGEFWKSNILSTKKLREQIDQLIAQKNAPKKDSNKPDSEIKKKIAQYD